MRAILTTAVDAILTIDEKGLVLSLNPAAQRLFGYDASELLGCNVSLLMPEPYRSAHDTYMRNYRRTGVARIIGIGREVVGRRKDASTFPMELAVSEIHLGQRTIFTGIIRDITDRRRLERQVLEISGEEQLRIGQDLHDGLCQQLAAVAYATQSLEQKLARRGAAERNDVVRIANLIDHAITQARGVARGLYPVKLEADGLAAALQQMAGDIQQASKLRCRFECHESVSLADHNVATHLYRIAQEAANNAVKHARANQLTISLARHENQLHLSIEDNGAGLPDAGQRPPGMGMQIMGYRARMIGATLQVKPNPRGRGTIVSCSLPCGESQFETNRTHAGQKTTRNSPGKAIRARQKKSPGG